MTAASSHLKAEHVLGVVLPVSGLLPQLGVVHIGRDDLGESPAPVLLPHHGHQLVVDVRAAGREEARAGAQLVEEEQLLRHADLTVVALRSLLLETQIDLSIRLCQSRNTLFSLISLL